MTPLVRRTTLVIGCLAALSFGAAEAFARTQHGGVAYVDASIARGLGGYRNEDGQGSGFACADFDNDGDVDIYVPQAGGRADQLYVNSGEGYFTEEAVPRGLGRMGQSRAAIWFDYDNDGDLDLIVENDDETETSSFYLYRQDTPFQFTDVTAAAGLVKPPVIIFDPLWWGGICAGDINNDGYLDVYSGQWGGPAHLFLNNGNGTFSDISYSSGVTFSGDDANRHMPVMFDFDGDGWTDIYVAVDFAPNELWINQHDNTFVNAAAAAGLANAMNDMGVALGDYDNDGDFDIYITNIYFQGKHNVLYRNDSVPDTLRYTEVSQSMGVADGRWGWGVTWMDMDNDGDVDLPETNGYFITGWATDTSKFFWNQEAGTLPFVEEGVVVGFKDSDWGSALGAVDFDMDGDLDLLQVCMKSSTTTGRLRLYDSQPAAPVNLNNWLIVRPRIDGPNRYAIGAVVHARAGELQMVRRISAGTGYLTQEPAEAYFGAWLHTQLDVTVDWPDGGHTVLTNVPANQVLTITRPAAPPTQVILKTVAPDRVRLGWQISGLANHDVTVERRTGAGAWTSLADLTTGTQGICHFDDTGVSAGATYSYRLSLSVEGTPFVVGEVSVTVPLPALSLAGPVPNPSPSGLHVQFSLPDASPATLTLHDLGGRTLRRVDAATFGPGVHSIDLAAGLDLSPGLYWVRLEQGGRVFTRKAALVP